MNTSKRNLDSSTIWPSFVRIFCLLLCSTVGLVSCVRPTAEEKIYESCTSASTYIGLIYTGEGDICKCISTYAAVDWAEKLTVSEIRKMSDVDIAVELVHTLKNPVYRKDISNCLLIEYGISEKTAENIASVISRIPLK